MPKLSREQKRFLVEATSRYHASLPGSVAEELLAKRGLQDAEKYRLGYVADPLPGHDMYRGMLAVPYLRRSSDGAWTTVSIRFRCLEDHDHREQGHGKYNTVAGDTPRLFNTLALITSDNTVAICEGELDAITASLCGVPAVGVAGVETWKDHFREPFLGYENVYILADGDKPGMDFASKLAKKLPNARIIPCAAGEDVNSEYVTHGAGYIKEKVK